MKNPPRLPYRSSDLIAAGAISKRQLTRWFAHGLLGPAPRRGPGVGYTEEQMLRARAAATLMRENHDLDMTRRRLDGATRGEVERWARGESPSSTDTASSSGAAAYPAAHYEHVELAPGLTLLVRSDCDPAVRRRAEEIYVGYGPGRR